MRSIYILLFYMLFVTNLTAQNKYLSKKISFNPNVLRANKQKTAKTLRTNAYNSGWFNYAATAQGSLCYYSSAYLFPDSTASFYSMGNSYPIWAHHITEVLDLKSPVFSGPLSTDWAVYGTLPIKIDSLGIGYGYSRVHTGITDTLIVTLFEDVTNGVSPFDEKYFLNTMGIPGNMDTIFYQQLGYNQLQNTIAVSSNTNAIPIGQKIFKILLTQTDTASIGKEKVFALPTPYISNGNKLVCVDFQFKPGYSYTTGESINVTANAFQFISMEEEGPYTLQGMLMNYWDYYSCHIPTNSTCDRGSSSQIITKDIRYNNGGVWNGYFRPAITFPQNWRLEHHSISFHLSEDMTNLCQANANFTISADTLNPGVYNGYNNCTGVGVFSYLWDFGDGTTSTLQYPTHQYAVSGQYIICLTLSTTSGTATCSNTYCDSSSVHKTAAGFSMSQFNVIAPIVTSINETQKTIDIKTYPNPISGELVVECTNKDFEKLNYVLIDALGRTILSNSLEKDKTTINTSQLSKGIYNLIIINADGNIIKSLKIIK